MFTEGDTIIFDNPLGEERYTAPSLRGHHLRQAFLSGKNIEPRSALEEPNSEKDETLLSALASQFMAAIPENPNSHDLARHFAGAMLSGKSQARGPLVMESVARIQASLLDPTDGAFAAAASPLRLTPLGEAANTTGFSPNSCRRIVKFLRKRDNSGDLVAVSAKLLRNLGTLPEQTNSGLKKVLTAKSSRFCVKPEDFGPLIELWLQGTSRESIFASLPYVQRSSIKPRIEDWLKGSKGNSGWDPVYDNFTDFISSVVEGFLPWLMRSCRRLGPHVGGWAEKVEWLQWAEIIETAGSPNPHP
jgi:helicase